MTDVVFIARIHDYDGDRLLGVFTNIDDAKATTGDDENHGVEEWTVGPDSKMLGEHRFVGRCPIVHRHSGPPECDYEWTWTHESSSD